jgi:hypothetical protein
MLSDESRDRCEVRAAVLETEIGYIERGDHLTGAEHEDPSDMALRHRQ